MAMLLTINAIPETFTSQLPKGIVGDVKALDLITPDNVEWIEEDNSGDYEENLDAEFTVCLKNGDMIQIDGYNALWEIKLWDHLRDDAKADVVNIFREWAQGIAKDILEG